MPLPLKTDGYFAFVPLPPAGMERILPASRAKSGYRIALRILFRLPVAFQNDFLCNTITSLIFAASCICCKRQVREACPERRPRCDFLLRGGQNHPQPVCAGAKRRKSRDARLRNLRRKHLFMRGKRGARYAVFRPKYCAAANKIKFRFAGREYLPGTICSQLLHRKHKQIVAGAGGLKPERLGFRP